MAAENSLKEVIFKQRSTSWRLRLGLILAVVFLLIAALSVTLRAPALEYVAIPTAFFSFYFLVFRLLFRSMGRNAYKHKFSESERERARKYAIPRYLLDLDFEDVK
ncbi:MAG: hypothetical protein OIF51_00095 [Cellvibrionaceae bacterium]|jgi:hypothetical protein|nr:hypothetical protein [Cellvibrionaceae bacterium]